MLLKFKYMLIYVNENGCPRDSFVLFQSFSLPFLLLAELLEVIDRIVSCDLSLRMKFS